MNNTSSIYKKEILVGNYVLNVGRMDDYVDYIEEIVHLLSLVFPRGGHNTKRFVWKHISSPLGSSVVSFIKDESGNCVAFRAFLPIKIADKLYWQPCDTAVNPEFRRKGFFSHMTCACLETLGENSSIVNFPNNYSLSGYLKLGWKQEIYSGYIFVNTSSLGHLWKLYKNRKEKFNPYRSTNAIFHHDIYLNWRLQSGYDYVIKRLSDGAEIIIRRGSRGTIVEYQLVYFNCSMAFVNEYCRMLINSKECDIISSYFMTEKLMSNGWLRIRSSINCVSINSHETLEESLTPLSIDTF